MGVWGKTWNRAVVFLGPGGFQVFPQCVSGLVPFCLFTRGAEL